MPQLASWECCTGCGACFSKCPQKCISFKEDKLGNIYPFIDEAACVNYIRWDIIKELLIEKTAITVSMLQ